MNAELSQSGELKFEWLRVLELLDEVIDAHMDERKGACGFHKPAT